MFSSVVYIATLLWILLSSSGIHIASYSYVAHNWMKFHNYDKKFAFVYYAGYANYVGLRLPCVVFPYTLTHVFLSDNSIEA